MPAKPLYGGLPSTTRIGVSCFTRSARSRSSSSSGNGSACVARDSHPLSAFVRKIPARSPLSAASGAPSSSSARPTCNCATTNGAGMISNPNTRSAAARFSR